MAATVSSLSVTLPEELEAIDIFAFDEPEAAALLIAFVTAVEVSTLGEAAGAAAVPEGVVPEFEFEFEFELPPGFPS